MFPFTARIVSTRGRTAVPLMRAPRRGGDEQRLRTKNLPNPRAFGVEKWSASRRNGEPTSVMELQEGSRTSLTDEWPMPASVVRFGNVLGSRGA